MAIDRDDLTKKIHELADEIDSESDLRGIKCALLTLCAVTVSGVPEHMHKLHDVVYYLAKEFEMDLVKRMREKYKDVPTLKLIQ